MMMMMMMKPLCCYAFSAFLSNLTQGKNRLSVFLSLSVSPHSKRSDVQKHPVNTLPPYLLMSFSLFCLLFFWCYFILLFGFQKTRGEQWPRKRSYPEEPDRFFSLSDQVRHNSAHGIRYERNYSFWSQARILEKIVCHLSPRACLSYGFPCVTVLVFSWRLWCL